MRLRLAAPRTTRDGFVLLTVLCLLAGLAVVAFGVRLLTRRVVDGARNRHDLIVAYWNAEGCLARGRAILDDLAQHRGVTEANEQQQVAMLWQDLDHATMQRFSALSGCTLSAQPLGLTLDINRADGEQLRRAFASNGYPTARADSLADALLDWRDADSMARPFGAESLWYATAGRMPPRNAPIGDVRELAEIRGFERVGRFRPLLGVDESRIWIARAPRAVLSALPAFGAELLGRLEGLRADQRQLPDLPALGSRLSPAAQQRLSNAFTTLDAMATATPDAWKLSATSTAPRSDVSVTIELRLTKTGNRITVARRAVRWGGA